MEPKEIVLEAKNICKEYIVKSNSKHNPRNYQFNEENTVFTALNDINFTLSKGDVLGIIGRNGCGKSTLLKILSQITHPTKGTVWFKGRMMSILDIGSGFHPELTGRENVYVYGSMLGISKKEIDFRINDIKEFSGIDAHFDKPIKIYSNGMYLRLAFSVAFFTDTDILVLDEVLAVGDVEFMVKCHKRIKKLIQNDMSLIIVSHSMNDIISLCNQCIWLEKGILKLKGLATDVVAAYLQSGWGISAGNNKNKGRNIVWEHNQCPHSDGLFIYSISVLNNHSDLSNEEYLDYNRPIEVEILFKTEEFNQNYSFVLILIDQYDVPVFLSTDHFEMDSKYKNNIVEKGTYITKCTIPAQYLNVGHFKLHIRIFKDNIKEILNLNNQIIFKIKSFEERQNKALLSTPMTVAPLFKWETKIISA